LRQRPGRGRVTRCFCQSFQYAVQYLAGCLAGEGRGEDIVGLNTLGEQGEIAVRQPVGLAATGRGADHHLREGFGIHASSPSSSSTRTGPLNTLSMQIAAKSSLYFGAGRVIRSNAPARRPRMTRRASSSASARVSSSHCAGATLVLSSCFGKLK